MTGHSNYQPVGVILRQIARELDDACVSIEELHSLVDASVARCGVNDKTLLRSAQNIDILHQELASLSHFVEELANLASPQWVVESHIAAQQLKLAKLKERLTHPFKSQASTLDYSDGDMEIL